MSFSNLLKPLSDTVNKVLDKFLPDRISEAEKAQIQQEMSGAIMDDLFKHQSVIAQLQLHKTGSKIVDGFRGIVRPVIAIGMFALYAYHKVETGFVFDEFDKAMVTTIFGFYFGLRSIEKFKNRAKN